jgi:hypothetical protein
VLKGALYNISIVKRTKAIQRRNKILKNKVIGTIYAFFGQVFSLEALGTSGFLKLI